MGEIAQAFLEGIKEIFTIMFTNEVYYYLLDEDETDVNVYGESTKKVYKEPVKLTCNVKSPIKEEDDLYIEDVKIDAVIKIPALIMMESTLSFQTAESREVLMRGKISYGGIDYLIDRIESTTLIDDTWQFYVFYCHVGKKFSVG